MWWRQPLYGIAFGVGIIAVCLALGSLVGCAGAETMGGQYGAAQAPELDDMPGTPTAGQVSCSDVTVLSATLASKFGETLAQGGALGVPTDPNKAWAALLFTNHQTGTWTLATARPDGRACVQLYGSGWGEPGAPSGSDS